MKKGAVIAALGASLLTAFADGPAVSYDAARHSVTFSALATECGPGVQLEFLFVGPGSDHDYEAMFVTEASVAEIAAAFEKAGIPRGKDVDLLSCRFWPVGEELEIEPAITNFVREVRDGNMPTIAFTGGIRDKQGIPMANTNSPEAVFAFYNLPQSLIQFNDSLDQSTAYGRFQPAVKVSKGEKHSFTFTWKGESAYDSLTLKLEPGKLAEALTLLKSRSEKKELDVVCDFSPELTLKEAQSHATALSMVDSVRVKINGSVTDQFFYRAFMPLEQWRDRKERLAQPPEVHLKGDGTAEVIETIEDWSDEDALDPKLTTKVHPCASDTQAAELAERLAAKTYTVFVFAAPETKLGRLHAIRRMVKGNVRNWYLFTE